MCMYQANRAYVCSCSVHLIVCCVHCYAVRLIIAFVDVNKTYLIILSPGQRLRLEIRRFTIKTVFGFIGSQVGMRNSPTVVR